MQSGISGSRWKKNKTQLPGFPDRFRHIDFFQDNRREASADLIDQVFVIPADGRFKQAVFDRCPTGIKLLCEMCGAVIPGRRQAVEVTAV